MSVLLPPSLPSPSLSARARPSRHRDADRSPEKGADGRMRSRSYTLTFGRDAARVATLRSRARGRDRAIDSASLSDAAAVRRVVADSDAELFCVVAAAPRGGGDASAELLDTADVRLQRWREVLARKHRAHASRSDSLSDGRAARSRSPGSQRFGPQTLLFRRRCRRRRRRPHPKNDGDGCASDDDNDTADERGSRDGLRRRSSKRRQGHDDDDDTDVASVPFARRRRRVPKCVAMEDAPESIQSPPHGSDIDVRVRNEVVHRIHLQMRHCSNYALDIVCDIIGDYAATSVLSPVASASSVPLLRCASACSEPSIS